MLMNMLSGFFIDYKDDGDGDDDKEDDDDGEDLSNTFDLLLGHVIRNSYWS